MNLNQGLQPVRHVISITVAHQELVVGLAVGDRSTHARGDRNPGRMRDGRIQIPAGSQGVTKAGGEMVFDDGREEWMHKGIRYRVGGMVVARPQGQLLRGLVGTAQ